MQELIIFTGNIGCGKSFMASKLAKKGYVVVNMDSITTMIQGGEYGMYDSKKRAIYQVAEKACIQTALGEGFSVVVDRTNMKASDRARYIKIGKSFEDVKITSYDWGPGDAESVNRRIKNPNGMPAEQWADVYANMKKSYEYPVVEEGFHHLEDGIQKYKFYAFDFDGTITVYKDKFPSLGEPDHITINKMKYLWEDLSNVIIIWTCRSGDYLNQARKWLIDNKVPFDFINENPMVDYGSPKIFAHEYYDDRNAV